MARPLWARGQSWTGRSVSPFRFELPQAWLAGLALLLILAWTTLAPQTAEARQAKPETAHRRVAMVIGNNDYLELNKLKNATADATLVGAALKAVGFDVKIVTNAGLAQMTMAMRQFSEAADGADVALVYFSGFGVEVNGENWLLPIDARVRTAADLSLEAMRQSTMISAMEGAKNRIVVLDAGRTNPFVRNNARGIHVEADNPPGVIVVYSSLPGTTAEDGTGDNSPFAIAFARRIGEPGIDLMGVIARIAFDVSLATDGRQRPSIYGDGFGETLYLGGAPAGPVAPRPPIIGSVRALEQPRLALVIGVGDYNLDQKITLGAPQQGYVRDLRNPRGDAEAMAQALIRLKFKVVPVLDPTREELAQALVSFAALIRGSGPETLVVVYYAGHAVQLNGRNYLLSAGTTIPKGDMRILSPADAQLVVSGMAISLDEVFARLRSPNEIGANVVILDACRDAPWLGATGTAEGATGDPGVTGLADQQPNRRRTLVAYAAGPGFTADDGNGAHSPFTQALLDRIEEPDVDVRDLFNEVGDAVDRATLGRQLPHVTSSPMGRICLGSCLSKVAVKDAAVP